jgi:flavorubredoxin
MCAFLENDRTLFSCDLFGSHLASSAPVVDDHARVHEAAKRYFASIMMPFGKLIDKHLRTLGALEPATICPSHGPIYRKPSVILDAYRQWVSGQLEDRVVVAYESMHHSTRAMVECLATGLGSRGVGVDLFELATTDLGRLAMALVDAPTVVLGTPTLAGGPHPSVLHAAYVISILRPRAKLYSILGSCGWSAAKTVKILTDTLGPAVGEMLEPVIATGMPKEADRVAVDQLAASIVQKHVALGVRPAAA